MKAITNFMRPIGLLSVLLLTLSFNGFAQKGSIEGYIGDQQTRSPISGVSITLSTGGTGDNSHDFGWFRINGLQAGQYEIIISHIGYDSEKVAVDIAENKTTNLKIELERGPV